MVMSVLGHRGQLSSAQLSRRFSVKPQSMFKLITTLERKTLIARKEVDRDRRTLMVSLTSAGRRLLAQCDDAVDALEADILKSFSSAQLRQFRCLSDQGHRRRPARQRQIQRPVIFARQLRGSGT